MSFGVYVHIPYCVTKCPYCDFNSYGVGDVFPEDKYTYSLLKEITFYQEQIKGAELTSVFFGGGTPSLFKPENIEKVLDAIYNVTSPDDNLEVTLEVNPKTAELTKLREFRAAGINRISVGIQSFSQRKLSFLGRINSPEDGERISNEIKLAGFENFNLDIMYGTKGETLAELEYDLKRAAALEPKHISAYCLTIEDGTQFGTLFKKGKLKLPDDDMLSHFIEFTTEYLGESGYAQYEISNYAQNGYECRHNLLYWRGDSYLGIGAGAHSHFSRTEDCPWGIRRGNLKSPSLYMERISNDKKPIDFTEQLSREESLEDCLLMGLRLREGVYLPGLKASHEVSCGTSEFDDLIDGGYVNVSDDRIMLTGKGTLLSNEIIMRIAGKLS